MQFKDICRIIVDYGYGLLASVFLTCVFGIVISFGVVFTCVDMAIPFNDYVCIWGIVIFTASLIVLLLIGNFIRRRASKLDLALSIISTGIVLCVFLEYTVGLTGYGNLLPLFTLMMGYIISGRMNRKITWKPQKQFFALFLTVVLSISLYTWGPNYIEIPPSYFEQEYLKLEPFVLRLVGELFILAAIVFFGKGAIEWLSVKTR